MYKNLEVYNSRIYGANLYETKPILMLGVVILITLFSIAFIFLIVKIIYSVIKLICNREADLEENTEENIHQTNTTLKTIYGGFTIGICIVHFLVKSMDTDDLRDNGKPMYTKIFIIL